MDIRPILSTLRRHKTAAALIVLEIALSCAIVCNALFLIATRMERIERPTGMEKAGLVRINLSNIGRVEDGDALTRRDVAALRAIPGVQEATALNHLPFDGSSWNSAINTRPDQDQPTLLTGVYFGDERMVETLGLRIVAGRDFLPEEYIDWGRLETEGNVAIPAAIITRTVAETLFPGEDPLGRQLHDFWGSAPVRVVGVVEDFIRPNDNGGPTQAYNSTLLPVRPVFGRYAIRTAPERRDEVLKAAVEVLTRNHPDRIILDQGSFEEVERDHYRQDTAMAWLLLTVCAVLLLITALGIVGLASFWVQQRTKQIGVRRALGATRAQVLRYFQTENFLLVSVGIVVGMIGAFGLNQVLMTHYALPRLPLWYLPVGAVSLWLLGQIAVFAPARRAASVPPAVATRSV